MTEMNVTGLCDAGFHDDCAPSGALLVSGGCECKCHEEDAGLMTVFLLEEIETAEQIACSRDLRELRRVKDALDLERHDKSVTGIVVPVTTTIRIVNVRRPT